MIKSCHLLCICWLSIALASCANKIHYPVLKTYAPEVEKSDFQYIVQKTYRTKNIKGEITKTRIDSYENKQKTFNKKGLKSTESKMDTTDQPTSTVYYFYNAKQQVKRTTCFSKNTWTGTSKYHYDRFGNVKKARSNNRKNKRFKFLFRCDYQYLNQKRIVQKFQNTYGALANKEYFFNEVGNYLSTSTCHYSNGLSQVITTINTYDERKRLVKTIFKSDHLIKNKYSTKVDSVIFLYDEEAGTKTQLIYDNSRSDKERVIQHITTYVYYYNQENILLRREKEGYNVLTEYEYLPYPSQVKNKTLK